MTHRPPKHEAVPEPLSFKQAAPDDSEKQLDVWGILRRRKWLIVFGVIVALGLGTLYYLNAPNRYASGSRVLIQKTSTGVIPITGSTPFMPEMTFESHDSVIASPFLVRNMIEANPQFFRTAEFLQKPYAKQLALALEIDSTAELTPGLQKAIAEGTILKGLEVQPNRDDPNVYDIYFEAEVDDLNKAECAEVIDLLITEYKRYLTLQEEKMDSGAKQMLQEALGQTRRDIEIINQQIELLRFGTSDPPTYLSRGNRTGRISVTEFDAAVKRAKEAEREAQINADPNFELTADEITLSPEKIAQIQNDLSKENYHSQIARELTDRLRLMLMRKEYAERLATARTLGTTDPFVSSFEEESVKPLETEDSPSVEPTPAPGPRPPRPPLSAEEQAMRDAELLAMQPAVEFPTIDEDDTGEEVAEEEPTETEEVVAEDTPKTDAELLAQVMSNLSLEEVPAFVEGLSADEEIEFALRLLGDASDELLVFDNENRIVNVASRRLEELELELAELRARREKVQHDLEWLVKEQASGVSEQQLVFLLERSLEENVSSSLMLGALDPRQEQAHITRVFELNAAIAAAESSFGKEHPDVKAAKTNLELYMQQWESFNASINAKSGITGGSLKNPTVADGNASTGNETETSTNSISVVDLYKTWFREQLITLSEEIEMTQRQFNANRIAAAKLSRIQHRDEELQMEKDRLDQAYSTLVALDNQTNWADSGTSNRATYEVTTLRPPVTNPTPVAPNAILVYALSVVAGLLAGFGLAYLVDIADKTFRSPAEITAQMGLPLIGHIPVISGDSRTAFTESTVDESVVTYHRPKSKMAEAYRAVRTGIYFSAHGQDHRVIQVTSPSPGDGKTTLACNLATSMANSGKRVLLVDADLRRPRVNKVFGDTNTVGCAAVLAGEAEYRDGVYESEVPNLWLMPCGNRPQNPAELLTAPKLTELFNVLREEFDYVIVDSPPVLAVTDPCAIAPRVDAVLLTFRIKKNVRLAAERAREALSSVSSNLLGVVVNGVGGGTPLTNTRYGYGNYASRYYSYNYTYGGSSLDLGYDFGYIDDYYDDDDDIEPAMTVTGSARPKKGK